MRGGNAKYETWIKELRKELRSVRSKTFCSTDNFNNYNNEFNQELVQLTSYEQRPGILTKTY